MALSPKLKTKVNINEETLIRKGGSSGAESLEEVYPQDEQAIKRVSLRIPAKYLESVDNALTSRLGNVSRNTWIIEAIAEKLGKEENANEVNLISSQP